MRLSSSDEGALNCELACEHSHVWEDEIARVDGERVDFCAGSESREVELPVWLGGGGDEEVVNSLADLELGDTLCGVEFCGA